MENNREYIEFSADKETGQVRVSGISDVADVIKEHNKQIKEYEKYCQHLEKGIRWALDNKGSSLVFMRLENLLKYHDENNLIEAPDYKEFDEWRNGTSLGKNTTISDLYNWWQENINTPQSSTEEEKDLWGEVLSDLMFDERDPGEKIKDLSSKFKISKR